MNVTLIGVGLISGSFALGLKKTYEGSLHVCGVDKDEQALQKAKALGIIHSIKPLNEAVAEADVIGIGIPVDALVKILPEILDDCKQNALVIDFGSTKKAICEVVAHHPKRTNFVAAHPIAGTEYSGPEAAFASLFEQKVMIVCEEEKSGSKQLELFRELCQMLEMRLTSMNPAEHDLHLAFVSHLSHVSSFALSQAVMQKERSEQRIFDMAGSGFASTVRLAKSSPEMWSPIFLQNKEHLLEGLSTYINQLQQFKSLLENEDTQGMKDYMKEANRIREIVDRIR